MHMQMCMWKPGLPPCLRQALCSLQCTPGQPACPLALRSLLSAVGVMGTGAHYSLGTQVGSTDPDSAPPAHVASTFPTEPSPWLHSVILPVKQGYDAYLLWQVYIPGRNTLWKENSLESERSHFKSDSGPILAVPFASVRLCLHICKHLKGLCEKGFAASFANTCCFVAALTAHIQDTACWASFLLTQN